MKKPTLLLLVVALVVLMSHGTGCRNSEDDRMEPAGTLLQYQGCKQWAIRGETGVLVSSNQDCLEYSYDGEKLKFKHVNAGFNCCPGEITAEIAIEDQVITITEMEQEAGCYCLCLFDLEFEIVNLDPGEYTLCIHEPYVNAEDQILQATLVLTSGISGTFCLERHYYPWGLTDF